MSISDRIVVMKQGVVQQLGRPQEVYDSPENLFVAKFLGTPQINVFEGRVSGEKLYIGEDAVLAVPGVPDQPVWAGVRPEGFVLADDGPFCCALRGVEVMGRDVSIVSVNAAAVSPTVRSIVSAETAAHVGAGTVRFALRPNKVFLFGRESEKRILF